MLTCAIKFSEYGVNNININLSLSQMIKSLVVKQWTWIRIPPIQKKKFISVLA